MAYLVLALGALLSLGGALSIFQGAGIVQVERGWTGVIAGATSLTGGVITIALGLILRTLLDLRAREFGSMALRLAPEPEPLEAPAAVAVPASAPAPASDLEHGLLAAFLAPRSEIDPAPAARSDPVDPAGRPSVPELRDYDLPVVSQEGLQEQTLREQALQEQALREQALREQAPQEEVPEDQGLHERNALERVAMEQPDLPKPRVRIGFEPPAEPLPPAAPPPPEDALPVPAMDDWLDRAFSSLDNEVATSPAEPKRQPSPRDAVTAASQSEAASGSLPHASHEYNDAVAELEPTPEPSAAPLPDPAPHPAATQPSQSAVIGRYEADGTSYVMFADGSIEAQSEAGVYRFSSMTELKAFIEGTA